MIKQIIKSTLPYLTFASLSFILSRVSFLLAMVLPWKILAVASGMGSAYFNALNFFDGYDEKLQVAYLGGVVVALFTIHLVLDFVFDYLVEKGAGKAIERSNKRGVFNNYRNFAKRIYKYYVTFFSAFLYTVLVFVLLAFFYPSLILNFVLYGFATFVVALVCLGVFELQVDERSSWLPVFYKVWWHVGFVLALIWAITDYWQETMPVLLITFLSLLLYRQGLVMITVMANNGQKIYTNRVRAGQIFSALPNSQYQVKAELNVEFEQLVTHIEQQNWLAEICREKFPDLLSNRLTKVCHLVEAGNVAYITVTPQSEELADGLLIKLFNTNREALAEQEIALLKSADNSWPFITLLEDRKINNYPAFICCWPVGSVWLQESERNTIAPELRKKLLLCDLPENVIMLYKHSQAGLLDRVNNVLWEHLQAYSGVNADKVDWDGLPAILSKLLPKIEEMPKQLSLGSLNSRMTLGSKEDPRIANVTRWAWEPVGSAWPLNRLKQFDEALLEAAKDRVELVEVDPEMAKLVARLYEFERRYRNKNYAGAVNVLSNLLNHFAELCSKDEDEEGVKDDA